MAPTAQRRGLVFMTWLAYLIAGISTAGFVAIWFVNAGKELSRAKQSMEVALRQLRLHQDAYPQVRDGPYARAADNARMTAHMIYLETVRGYEATRQRPMNRLPALLLGYFQMKEVEVD